MSNTQRPDTKIRHAALQYLQRKAHPRRRHPGAPLPRRPRHSVPAACACANATAPSAPIRSTGTGSDTGSGPGFSIDTRANRACRAHSNALFDASNRRSGLEDWWVAFRGIRRADDPDGVGGLWGGSSAIWIVLKEGFWGCEERIYQSLGVGGRGVLEFWNRIDLTAITSVQW